MAGKFRYVNFRVNNCSQYFIIKTLSSMSSREMGGYSQVQMQLCNFMCICNFTIIYAHLHNGFLNGSL